MDEFTDVNDIELQFCTTWNRFIDSHPALLRSELPCRFLEFIELYAADCSTSMSDEEKEQKTKYFSYENFILFLLSRWDEGEINRTQLYEIVEWYDAWIDSESTE